jgi:4-alpha-glucanotransferase
LPAQTSSQVSWQIITEQGEQISDQFFINELAFIEQNQLGEKQFNKYWLPIPKLNDGYHKLTVTFAEQQHSCHLIFAPKTCYGAKQAAPYKMWGLAAQLYSLHSDNSWGMGDFGDLTTLVKQSANHGVSAIGLNPLHPLYQNNPAHRSPYSPTSRCFLNTLYINVTNVPNFQSCLAAQEKVASEQFQQQLSQAQQSHLIDYPLAAHLKFEVLRLLFTDFLTQHIAINSELAQQFSAFKQQGGQDLLNLATYEALYQHFREQDANAYGWQHWPEAFQQANTAAVREFQQQNSQLVDYFMFLQWQAHSQLQQASECAKQGGMAIGLYLDLAVGCDGSGVDVWANRDVYVSGAAVGAPPDALNTLGQDWGLTPMNPVALQAQGYMPLVKALRSNMQYAGALRIDHILGLMRQYWVAPGMKADQGVYITYPLDDILRIIALESRRANCVVIGEDLGTVPEGFSEIMQASGLLSYKVLFFETWESGLFKRPEMYPEQSMVTVSTHDLPTLAGWWIGNDLKWRQTLNLYPNEKMGQDDRENRVRDRANLIAALEDMQVIANDKIPSMSPAIMNRELTLAVQKFLANANSQIQLIPLEDSLECIEQVNIPGTVEEHPNWAQKLPVSIEQYWQTESVLQIAAAMQQARPTPKKG